MAWRLLQIIGILPSNHADPLIDLRAEGPEMEPDEKAVQALLSLLPEHKRLIFRMMTMFREKDELFGVDPELPEFPEKTDHSYTNEQLSRDIIRCSLAHKSSDAPE